jgi:murein L,D-transpeptidase YcbB/YkuD
VVRLFALAFLPLALGAQTESQNCSNVICRMVARGRLSDLHWQDYADFRSRLNTFYQPEYSLAWSENEKPTAKALTVIALLQAADRQGLEPEDYDASRWAERLAHFDPPIFDLTLTVCLMRYLADLHFGKANPGFSHLDAQQQDFDIPAFLRTKLMEAADANALIAAEVEPPFQGYKRALNTLAHYLALAREAQVTLADIAATVEPGQRYAELLKLAERLRRLGDLPGEKALPANSKVYRGFIVEAVKHFQARHGLEPDGRLGKSTIQQLNVPLSARVLQLRLALERWRWVPHSFSRPPIVVNIPEFSLRALNSAYETELETKVVVGAAYENETPVFSADLTHITFRPYWNVPRSILLNEMAAELAEDRNYLATHRYQVVNASDKVILTQSGLTNAVLNGLLAGRYRIRQIPGPNNALGLIRFGLPNSHNVYLHGTPSQMLFAKSRRDFSHGCVRVERPVELAEWCLRETGPWTRAKILAAMRGSKTFQVNLKAPIPVLLVYATAVALSDDEVHFVSDIYHQDALLQNRLTQGYPSRTTAP